MKTVPLVCIVDDRTDYRLLLQQVLNVSCPRHSLSLFTSGEALLEAMTQFVVLPSFVLLDQGIPGIGGYRTLLRLKSHPIYRRVPVIMMSTLASDRDINACYQAGANSYVQKPPTSSGLADQLGTLFQYWFEINHLPLIAPFSWPFLVFVP